MGGDEVDKDAWEDNPLIQQFIKQQKLADEHALQAWFIARYGKMLQRLGKLPIGWDEVAGEHYPAGAIVNKWRTLEYTADEKRNPIVLSAGFYLDHMQSAWRHYRNDPERLPNAQGASVLGGEASAWGESIDPKTIDARIWPRTLAVAELLWSPAAETAKQSEEQLYRRLQIHSEQLQGLNHLSHMNDWFVDLLGAERAEPVLTLASVSRPEMFSSMVTALPRLIRWPWDETLYDEPWPLNAFIDHLQPESMMAWRFNHTVERYLQQPYDADRDYLKQNLLRWRDNHEVLLAVLAHSPELRDINIAPLSFALKELAEAGLVALDALDKGLALRDTRPGKIEDKYAFVDPEMSGDWFRQEVLRPRNLLRPLILLQVKLPVQRGVAELVQAAEGTK